MIIITKPVITKFILDKEVIKLRIHYFNSRNTEKSLAILFCPIAILIEILENEGTEVSEDFLLKMSKIEKIKSSILSEVPIEIYTKRAVLISNSDLICEPASYDVHVKNTQEESLTVKDFISYNSLNAQIYALDQIALFSGLKHLFKEYDKVLTLVEKGYDYSKAMKLYNLNNPYVEYMILSCLSKNIKNEIELKIKSKNTEDDDMPF